MPGTAGTIWLILPEHCKGRTKLTSSNIHRPALLLLTRYLDNKDLICPIGKEDILYDYYFFNRKVNPRFLLFV